MHNDVKMGGEFLKHIRTCAPEGYAANGYRSEIRIKRRERLNRDTYAHNVVLPPQPRQRPPIHFRLVRILVVCFTSPLRVVSITDSELRASYTACLLRTLNEQMHLPVWWCIIRRKTSLENSFLFKITINEFQNRRKVTSL